MAIPKRQTTVGLTAEDQAHIAEIVQNGFADSLIGAIRFALALTARWSQTNKKFPK